MRCPECGSTLHERVRKGPHALRGPVDAADRTWRVHQCLTCRHVFVSEQRAVAGLDAAVWADIFENKTPPPSYSDDKPTPVA